MKTKPVPPEQARPSRITDLQAVRTKGGVELSWTRPERYESGKFMLDLNSFVLLRAVDGGDFRQLATIKITDRERFRYKKDYVYLDRRVQRGHAYRYIVVSVTDEGDESLPSNVARADLRESADTPAK